MTKELLGKVQNTPGLCSKSEIIQVKDYYNDLMVLLKPFEDEFHYPPTYNGLIGKLERLQYYVDTWRKETDDH